MTAIYVQPALAGTPDHLTAWYRGHQIALVEVAKHHCYEAGSMKIFCFDSAAKRDATMRVTFEAQGESPAELPPGLAYVTFYADINYGGASFTTADSISDLGTIGWNDRISSFTSLNSGHPKWWRDSGFSGTAWQWSVGASVSDVGSAANDQFSSVENVP